MKLCSRMISTIAVALSLTPALLLNAQEKPNSPEVATTNNADADQSPGARASDTVGAAA